MGGAYVRKKLLGSIFTGKLVFENGNYRTTGLNEAVALIGLFQKDLQNKKAEHLAISDKTFGNVPKTGLEPAHSLEYKNLNLVCLPISPPGHAQESSFISTLQLFRQTASA